MNVAVRMPVDGAMSQKSASAARWRCRRPHRAVVLAAAVLSWLLFARAARAERIEPVLEAVIHLKALGYDRAIADPEGKPFVIAVIYLDGDASSKKLAEAMTDAFRSLAENMALHGRPIAAVAVPFARATIAQDLLAVQASALYLTPGLHGEAAGISATAREMQLPSLCGDQELVRQGLAVIGVFRRGTRPGLAVHVGAARASGRDFDSSLFSVAYVFK